MGDVQIQSYVPNAGAQLAFHASPAKHRALAGAAGSGKSTSAIWEGIKWAQKFPGSTGLVARVTYPSLRDTIQKDYLSIVADELVQTFVRTPGKEELKYHNGSRVFFRCLDDPRKFGSTQFDWITIHEADEVSESMFFTLAFQRLRGVVGPRRTVWEFNPPDEDHWLYTQFVAKPIPDSEVFHLSTYDNAAHLPAGYIENLEQMPEPLKQRFLYGKWGFTPKGAGVFAGSFSMDHCTDLTPMPGVPVIRGWDFGFHHPVCVLIQIDHQDRVNVVREVVGHDEQLRDFAAKVVTATREWFPGSPVEDYCDVAGNQRNDRGPTACQILANEFHLTPMTRKMGVHQGIEALHWLLAKPNGLRIDHGCRWGIKAFCGGYYIDPKTDEPAKQPGECYDDWMDALRYAVVPKILPAFSRWKANQRLPEWRKAV